MVEPAPGPERPWNLNIHYDQRLAALASPGDRVLDVGCGDGFLAARLADRGCRVLGLDADAEVLDRARARWPASGVTWVCGDVLARIDDPSHAVEGRFDAVLSNATLHHLSDTSAALLRLAQLVRPGGVVGVVGFARNGMLDWPRSLIGSVGAFVIVRWKKKWEHTAPQHWPPELTYSQIRRVASAALPGSRFRRLWLGRYLLTWTKPSVGG